MEDVLVPIFVCGFLFIGLPWLIFHYITQWKKGGALTIEDERLLDEMHDLARRLSERLDTVERIVAADIPAFVPAPPGLTKATPRSPKSAASSARTRCWAIAETTPGHASASAERQEI